MIVIYHKDNMITVTSYHNHNGIITESNLKLEKTKAQHKPKSAILK